MTSTQIRQSFLDFFKSKGHTIVPSSPLLPDSPNLLFTNAGMNQFVPLFLGQKKADVNTWAGAIVGGDTVATRAADTQKCIRAGGKHNDLDDVGLDTYHHTFFEMLGNWSFGDYFKKEAIGWAWELVVGVWKFPADRLYATVFCPYLGEPGWEKKWQTELEQVLALAMTSPDFIPPNPNASPFEIADQEAAMHWAKMFAAAGRDPKIHILPGNKKDNFWMMGDTGPCGPCSELHVDLTPAGDTRGGLVNRGDARCIEIWNLVFIQFNANPDGTFAPLPAKHVDTGMGFERVTSIIQGTKGFKDFAHAKISNYETDIFRPLFDAIENLSGKKYGSTLPGDSSIPHPASRIQTDIAFRVIADHIRTLSFAIADGIQPGNTDRNYVLRRILRRAVRYGRALGFHEPFFYKLVAVLAETMGDVFPEIRSKRNHVEEVIQREEEAFNKTLDAGLKVFEDMVRLKHGTVTLRKMLSDLLKIADAAEENPELQLRSAAVGALGTAAAMIMTGLRDLDDQLASRIMERTDLRRLISGANAITSALLAHGSSPKPEDQKSLALIADHFRSSIAEFLKVSRGLVGVFNGEAAFLLYDTYGFPLDLTELMARERGMTVDKESFDRLMEEQKARARAAQKKEVISLSQIETTSPTQFVGFDRLVTSAKVLEVVSIKGKTAVILDTSACYAEMGGQVGDTGEILVADLQSGMNSPTSVLSQARLRITNTQKSGNAWLHFIEHPASSVQHPDTPAIGSIVTLTVEKPRREAIQRHHTVTHLLHWALHEVVSREASQKGSFVGPDKLTFDFNSAPLTPSQVADVEKLVNERIVENAGVSWTEVPFADVKSRKDVMQFFGDKYGDTVRVVQIGGGAGELNGYSMELCGGTHTRATGEIGLFRIVGESAIAAGVRRIEAIAGLEAYRKAADEVALIKTLAGKVNSPVLELEKKIEALLAHQKELEKEVKIAMQRNASNAASELLGHVQTVNPAGGGAGGIPFITHNLGDADGDFLQAIADALKGRFKGVVVLGGGGSDAVALVATVSPEFTSKIQAGKIIQQIAPIVGGKGGGRPDNARGGGKDAGKLDEALAKVRTLLG
jgi:alanyl-tRNA synthetase